MSAGQQARRRAILGASQHLLAEREYEQIQMREVAEEAGVALGTLYRYFPSKELLYAHALLDWSSSFEGGRVPRLDTDAARLRATLRGAVRAYERAPTYFRLLTVLEASTDPGVREIYAAFSDRFVTLLRDVLVDTDDRTAAEIAFLAGSAIGSGLRQWAKGGRSIRWVYDRMDATVALLLP